MFRVSESEAAAFPSAVWIPCSFLENIYTPSTCCLMAFMRMVVVVFRSGLKS